MNITNIIVAVILATLLIVSFYLLIAYVFKIAWNASIPIIFQGVGEIDIKQAICLIIIFSLLFGKWNNSIKYCRDLW